MLPSTPERPYPVYSRTALPQQSFSYALEDFLGGTNWRDWDGRVAASKLNIRKGRGNGYIDLDATYLMSQEALLSKKYKMVSMFNSSSMTTFNNYIYIPEFKGYISLKDIVTQTSNDSVTQVIGFWRGPSGQLPGRFDQFDETLCPVQFVGKIPKV